METQNTIAAEEYCAHYHIEISFIRALEQYELLSITTIGEKAYLQLEQLPQIERYTRLHYDLNINLEGIEAIARLLNRMDHLQKEKMQLRNKLSVYEI